MSFQAEHVAHAMPLGAWARTPALTDHAHYRSRCDSMLNLFDAGRAPPWYPGEELNDYRRRLLETAQPYALRLVADQFVADSATSDPDDPAEFKRRHAAWLRHQYEIPYEANTSLRRLAVRHLNDELLTVFEKQYYNDTEVAFKTARGPLRQVTVADAAGRPRIFTYGYPGFCWDPCKPEVGRCISRVDPRVHNIGRGADAPNAIKPVGVLYSDGSTRTC